MNKICTSIEQSKKLIKLGIDVNSADMYWLNRHIDLTETKYEVFVINKSNKYIDFFKSYAVAIEAKEIIPAWSLGALLEIIRINGSYGLQMDEEGFYLENEDGDIMTESYFNPIDACMEMIVKLKESNIL